MQAITAIAHIQASILFFIDLSPECEYSIEKQLHLFNFLQPIFSSKPIVLVASKCDMVSCRIKNTNTAQARGAAGGRPRDDKSFTGKAWPPANWAEQSVGGGHHGCTEPGCGHAARGARAEEAGVSKDGGYPEPTADHSACAKGSQSGSSFDFFLIFAFSLFFHFILSFIFLINYYFILFCFLFYFYIFSLFAQND